MFVIFTSGQRADGLATAKILRSMANLECIFDRFVVDRRPGRARASAASSPSGAPRLFGHRNLARPYRQARARGPRPGRRHPRNGHVLSCLLIPTDIPGNYSRNGWPGPRTLSFCDHRAQNNSQKGSCFAGCSWLFSLTLLIYRSSLHKAKIKLLSDNCGNSVEGGIRGRQTRSGPMRHCAEAAAPRSWRNGRASRAIARS